MPGKTDRRPSPERRERRSGETSVCDEQGHWALGDDDAGRCHRLGEDVIDPADQMGSSSRIVPTISSWNRVVATVLGSESIEVKLIEGMAKSS